ncbi:MAG: RNA polymerase factor sigma-32 [Deltaproteobacteria bacterium]|nr:RNA polymerase factor sigma-32 [Deltaproteobacteria bacterium]
MSKLPVLAGSRVPAKISPLQLYLQEIAKYPLLTPEEEFELAKQHYEESDIKAAHRLITANLRLVVKIANEFCRAQANLLDLIQEGNYGLMQAVKKFNPYKGVKLASYAAWWIRAYILKYLMDHRSQVKIATTAAQRKLYYNLQKETDRLLAEYDTADPKQIAARLKVPEKDVLEMQKRLMGPDLSLNAPLRFGESSSDREDFLVDKEEQSIDDMLAERQVRLIFSQYLQDFKKVLKGREKEIFELRLTSEHPLTLQEIGEKYKISRERVRQVETRIIQKLRNFVQEKGTLDI